MLQTKYFSFAFILIVMLTGWALVFWPTLYSMSMIWRLSDTYTHCFIVPLISLWLIYERRNQISARPQPSIWPLFGLLVCCLVWLVGYSADVNTLTHFSAVISLQMVLLSLVGWKLGLQIAFPLFYLIFLVPFGDALNAPLQEITADASVLLLQWAGIPVLREGLYLTTPVGQFEVAEACSGLRFLIASLAIGAVFSYLTYQRWWKHSLFIISIVLFSVLANCVRAFFLIWIGETTQMKYGFGADHYLYGWIFFGLVMFFMFWLGGKYADPVQAAVQTKYQQVNSGYGLTTISAITLLTLTFILQFQITVTPTPMQPAQAEIPAGLSVAKQSDWQPAFHDGISRLHASDNQGVQYLFARYGHKQDRGELIGWSNHLFSRREWRIMNTFSKTTLDKPLKIIELRNSVGRYQTVVFYYRIGNKYTNSELFAKAWQVQALLFYKDGYSEIRAAHFNRAVSEVTDIDLERAIVQLDAIQ